MHVTKAVEMEKRGKAEMAQKLAEMQTVRLDYSVPELMLFKQHPRARSTEQPPAAVPTIWLNATRGPPYNQETGIAVPESAPESAVESAPERQKAVDDDPCGTMETLQILAMLLGFVLLVRFILRHKYYVKPCIRRRRLVITYQPPLPFNGFYNSFSDETSSLSDYYTDKESPPSYRKYSTSLTSLNSHNYDLIDEKQPQSEIVFTSNRSTGPPIRFPEKTPLHFNFTSKQNCGRNPYAIYINLPFDLYADLDDKKTDVFIGFSSNYPNGVDFGVIVNKFGELEVANKEEWMEAYQRSDDNIEEVKV